HPTTRRHVRSFLAKPEPVAEAEAAKDKIASRPRNFKPRAFDHLPSQNSSDNQFEVPTSNHAPARAFDYQRLGPARGVSPADGDGSESGARVRPLVTLQSFGELIGRNLLHPAAMRHSLAKIVAHAAKV